MGSRAIVAKSLDDLRQRSTAVLLGTVVDSTHAVLARDAKLPNAIVTNATIRVDKLTWGALPVSQIVVSQLGGDDGPLLTGREFLRVGERYLLYVQADDLGAGRGFYNVVGDAEYRLVGDGYENVTELVDKIPISLSVAEAERSITSTN